MPAITVQPQDLTLHNLYRWERETPDAIFLTQPMGRGVVLDLRWKEAMAQARRMAAWLQAQGWPEGSRVAILGKNSAHWLLADVAILMAGHISVPIYPTFNAEALRYILQHSGCRACFVGKLDDTRALSSGVPEDVRLVALPLSPSVPQASAWDALVQATAPLQTDTLARAEQVATIIYTSGTTGKPKGVVQTFGALAWALNSAGPRLGVGPGERFLSYLPLAHVAERMLIEQGAIRHGSRIFFAESLDTFIQDLQRARPTIFFSVPRLWVKFQQGVHSRMPPRRLQRLLHIPLLGRLVRRKILAGLGLDRCRIAAGGAAPMPPEVLGWFRTLGLDLIEVYGMTENCGASHSTLPGSQHAGSVGLPYDGIESRIDPANGEVQMRSGALMQGYYLEPELNAATFTSDGWLRTGDKGSIDAHGHLQITGRVKDIFKTSKGKYVAPAPIEDLLVLHPAVEACCVTGANQPQPFALVMLGADALQQAGSAQGRAALEASLATHLQAVNARLEPHEKLDLLAAVTVPWTAENGMVTPTLKVKRQQVEQAYGAQYDAWLAAPRPVVWAHEA